MYGPPSAAATSKDPNLRYPLVAVFGGRTKEEPEHELLLRHEPQQQQQQMSSGLLRFRSAPSSLLPVRPTETENMFARLFALDLRDKPSGCAAVDCQRNPQFRQPQPPPSAEVVSSQRKVAFSSAPPMMYRHSQHPRQHLQMPNHSLMENSHWVEGSMAMEVEQIENGGGSNSSSLTRQSSSPAGLFSHLIVDNGGYSMMRGLGRFGNGNLPPIGDAANSFKGQPSFGSRQNSLMSQISETGSEEISRSSHEESGGQGCIPGFPATAWEETSLFSANNFSGMKRGREGERKIIVGLNQSEPQDGGKRNYVSGSTHQLSLPKTLSEMAAIENVLQFQDAVPCRIRAKRGCATHPRSIAERVRRTKISERMRKLQDLVPNMDTQTNTADMLDLAVDYIKDLQKQVKTLREGRASCTCLPIEQKSYPNSGARDG